MHERLIAVAQVHAAPIRCGRYFTIRPSALNVALGPVPLILTMVETAHIVLILMTIPGGATAKPALYADWRGITGLILRCSPV
jgi:hypothetical protein